MSNCTFKSTVEETPPKMNGQELGLEAKLSFLTEQLSLEQENNKQLHLEIDRAYARERASLKALKEFERQLHDAVAEKERLKTENNQLQFHLSESRKIIEGRETKEGEANVQRQNRCQCDKASKSTSDREHSGYSISPSSIGNLNKLLAMGNLRDEKQKSWRLEQQIVALTRDKKQLMTHIHWLSRQRAEQSQQDYVPCGLESEGKNTSLEEGSGTKFDSLLTRLSRHDAYSMRDKLCENAVGTSHVENKSIIENSQHISKNTEYFGVGEKLLDTRNRKQLKEMEVEERRQTEKKRFTDKHPKERQSNDRQRTGRKLTERQLKEKLASLKATMLAVKEIVTKNNETCDSIFQLSFQNIKHPNEPRSYRMWSSHDEEDISSLVKSQERASILKTRGWCSLQNFPEMQNGVLNTHGCQGIAEKRVTSTSSPKLLREEKPISNEHSLNGSSFEMASRTASQFSRSLSDLGTMYRPSTERCFERLSLARGAAQQLTSTFTNEELQSASFNTPITDIQGVPYDFSPIERVVKSPPAESIEDKAQLFQNFPPSLTKRFSENLIS